MENLHPVMSFLKELKKHNEKAWMEAHKPAYQRSYDMFAQLAAQLIEDMAPWEPTIADLAPKDCIFRINRDLRFSQDKSPYKTNMGLYLTPGGRNSGHAGYYLHIEPHNRSFIAGGIHQPARSSLQRIRQEIDYNAEELLQTIQAPQFQKLFGPLQGDRLKRIPHGYTANHPHLSLLQMKSFLATHPVKDNVVTKAGFPSYVTEVFQAMAHLVKFLNKAIDI